MENEMTYEAAFEELKGIAAAIEHDTISVDELTQKLKRAAVLLEICQARLRFTESEVNKITGQVPSAYS
ncbi:exodeoxyribonuclease VII small subunit [Flavihumibacter petaseus]|uniref:Exodeoxyribonuclease VII small subunit n=1 Tax=Flavihumibacter petaseus NBRC 106054 TaxID=1220578 RepID=A0A0E9MXZ3_9BACT|nr:exodeoxyribonuclease VII small subunit [Flavihumibacter petaseus]GAO42449.1 putative exodeoxyribonuclease VII small subunit [Flavihumibacter petaseus NBRC 106054]